MARRNNMLFNAKKFELLRYGNKTNLKTSSYSQPNSSEKITVKNVLRDLGVEMSDNATFTEHINKVCCKASQKAGWILRTFACRQTWFMKLMWKSLVQGHIEYSSQLYQPLQSPNLMQIEQVQRTFTNLIPEVKGLSYWERIKVLKMYSQQRRLERYRMIYTWKVLEGLVPNPGLEECTSGIRGRECKIPPVKSCSSERIKSLREASFQIHGPRLFNSLPQYLRKLSKCGVAEFKEKLDSFLTKIPDQPKMGDLYPACCDQRTSSPSNSLVDQIRLFMKETGGRTRTLG